jgi:hypothetical protein
VREARGRSRGGYGTKAWVIADGVIADGVIADGVIADGVIADGRGRAIAFALAPGPAPEPPLAPGLLGVACPEWLYANRHLVENLRARLKEWRAVATRYENTAPSCLGILCLAATAERLK